MSRVAVIILALFCLSVAQADDCYECQYTEGCKESTKASKMYKCMEDCNDPFQNTSKTLATKVQCSVGCYTIKGNDADGNKFVYRGCSDDYPQYPKCEPGDYFETYLDNANLKSHSRDKYERIDATVSCCFEDQCNGSESLIALCGLIFALVMAFFSA